MKLFNFLKKYYAFNQYNRDIWMQEKAKEIAKDSIVLDIGAGSAPYRNLFNHCDYKTQDFAQLKENQLRGLKGYNRIDYISDIVNIPIAEGSIDTILCTEVLEHVPFPILAIQEFSRLLKNDGILLLSAPLGSGIHQEPYHYYGGYTPYWYSKFLTANGFIIMELKPNMKFYSFFSQEFIRFIFRTKPWGSFQNLIFTPIWLLLIPFMVIIPLFAPLLDTKDTLSDFTVGYFVKAIKKENGNS